jgi:hypothetical protein
MKVDSDCTTLIWDRDAEPNKAYCRETTILKTQTHDQRGIAIARIRAHENVPPSIAKLPRRAQIVTKKTGKITARWDQAAPCDTDSCAFPSKLVCRFDSPLSRNSLEVGRAMAHCSHTVRPRHKEPRRDRTLLGVHGHLLTIPSSPASQTCSITSAAPPGCCLSSISRNSALPCAK